MQHKMTALPSQSSRASKLPSHLASKPPLHPNPISSPNPSQSLAQQKVKGQSDTVCSLYTLPLPVRHGLLGFRAAEAAEVGRPPLGVPLCSTCHTSAHFTGNLLIADNAKVAATKAKTTRVRVQQGDCLTAWLPDCLVA